jgi:hypothetical protein
MLSFPSILPLPTIPARWCAFFFLFLLSAPLSAETRYELIGLLPKGVSTASQVRNTFRINDRGESIADSFYFDQSGAYADLRINKQSAPVTANNEIRNITNGGELVGSFTFPSDDNLLYTFPLSTPSYQEFSVLNGTSHVFNRPVFGIDAKNAVGECFFSTSGVFFASAACGVVQGEFTLFSLSLDNVLTFSSKPEEFLPQKTQTAHAMNYDGVVVGEAIANYDGKLIFPDDSRNQRRAFRWTKESGASDLGTLGGKNSAAFDINSAGVIIGYADLYSTSQGDNPERAFLHPPGGNMLQVQTPEGMYSAARSINDAGVFVGENGYSPATTTAFIGSSSDLSHVTTLQDLLHPVFKSIPLYTASGINTASEIVGTSGDIYFEGYLARPLKEELRPFPFTGGRSVEGTADFLIWRPENGTWYSIRPDAGDPASKTSASDQENTFVKQWGLPGDIPLFGTDFDGDGIDDLTVFRPASGYWHICLSSHEFDCSKALHVQFGLPGDIPVVGDFDNDGITDFVVFRRALPAAGIIGQWYIRRSSDGVIVTQQWGLQEDYPLQGDFNGDGYSDFAVYRPSLGMWLVLFSNQPESGERKFLMKQFGLPDDHPMPRDIDADGVSDLVIYRPSHGVWMSCSSSKEFSCLKEDLTPINPSFQFGLSGDIPLLRNVIGSHTVPYAIWRPLDTFLKNEGGWYTNIPETEISLSRKCWGLKNDIPAGIGVRDLLQRTNSPS